MTFTLGVIDLIGLSLAIVSLAMTIKLVLRTEKGLDKAAKCLVAFSLILVIANFTSINDYFGGVIPSDINRIIFHSSRVLSLVCFITAMLHLIKITEKR
ncbi:MAG: hypothetical protein US57_C0004G0003 [Candidatus Moranbacteria bacterium GW2011_GWC2_37_73]|nr:MAG: hypothetical protein UR95_C0002G0096 [Parcubacteria group bacterium GW2011_GWC1_36_108]KKQ01061.1 MAG: hypothetical protein US09_C0003G0061 [Candidatus Moranbacteria bacterium GW2011_GWD1_36_198]KKQ02463.1 MAG: hypothetical protein US10_C0001G0061 [Candidatus Moranbacteria bacterium GW2011_GWD2_36_198]KKQ40120.1 MAG: hypothetical protein US57_C0004G0003 [Candidatus Moranbacteria bacterium GW2011_GWC2_37_73]HAS00259.1 hypothetical protein [Candidatus Moranbacteria bacterium]